MDAKLKPLPYVPQAYLSSPKLSLNVEALNQYFDHDMTTAQFEGTGNEDLNEKVVNLNLFFSFRFFEYKRRMPRARPLTPALRFKFQEKLLF